jgi:hypothetical protein
MVDTKNSPFGVTQPTMNTTPKHLVPQPIAQKLDEVRQVLRGYLTKKWLYMLLCWLLLIFWLGAAIDYLPVRVGSDETPRFARIGILAVMGIGSLWLLFGWLLPRLMRPLSDSSVALLIERKQPELGNRFITAVQVCDSHPDVSDLAAHQQMFERVLEQASQSASSVNVQQLFNWRPLNAVRMMALTGLLSTGIVAVVAWPWFSLWSTRLFGLRDTAWPRSASLRADWLQLPLATFTGQLSAQQIQIEFVDRLARIPSGSSPRLQVSADASAPKIPEVCTLHYRSDDGTRGRANLRRIGSPHEGWQQFSLDGPPFDTVTSSHVLNIIGLDARLRDLRLEVIDPVVVVDMQLECVYPKYLLDSLSSRPPQESLPYRTGMKIPEGTVCSLVGRCSSPLKQVDYTSSGIISAESTEVVIHQAEVSEAEFRIALGTMTASQLIEVRLLDHYGLPSEQVLRYNVMVQPDTVPEVQSRLEGIGMAITPQAILPVRGQVTDDHEIAEVAVEMSINETAISPIPLQLLDTQLSGDIDLQKMASEGKLTVAPGTTLGLSVKAQDRFDLGGQQHIGRGQPQQLAVVTTDALLVVLDRQELELRKRLEQIISELQQLDDALKDLVVQLSDAEASAFVPQEASVSQSMTIASQEDAKAVDDQTEKDSQNQAANQQAEKQAIQRLAVLKAQQGQLQTDKSRQELAGIVNRVEHLRLQLVNNRIDSVDRQQRLLEQVHKPLSQLLAGEYVELDRQMSRLQSAVLAGKGQTSADDAAQSLERVLQALETIKSNMLDIESFNEIIDLVRGLLDEQERILKATEEAQKGKLENLFK